MAQLRKHPDRVLGRCLLELPIAGKRVFEAACQKLGIRWTRTQPYHPWTNGRAERFIRTLQRECVYEGEQFTTDEERRYAIARWLTFYNSGRPHTALDGLSPERWLRARGVTKV